MDHNHEISVKWYGMLFNALCGFAESCEYIYGREVGSFHHSLVGLIRFNAFKRFRLLKIESEDKSIYFYATPKLFVARINLNIIGMSLYNGEGIGTEYLTIREKNFVKSVELRESVSDTEPALHNFSVDDTWEPLCKKLCSLIRGLDIYLMNNHAPNPRKKNV